MPREATAFAGLPGSRKVPVVPARHGSLQSAGPRNLTGRDVAMQDPPLPSAQQVADTADAHAA